MAHAFGRYPLAVFSAALFLVFSCIPGGEQGPAEEVENAITALLPSAPAEDTQGPQDEAPADHLVLERGNRWIAGIPGFGENALRSFTGEYRISGKTELAQIWLTRELLYFAGWERQDNTAPAIYTSTAPGFTVIDPDGIWTVMVYLPPDLDTGTESRILSACIGTFSNISTPARDMSLPAIIQY
jgi:hypothetical protein